MSARFQRRSWLLCHRCQRGFALSNLKVPTAFWAANVQAHRVRFGSVNRTSCHVVPVMLVARRSRTPSASPETLPLFIRPSTVCDGSCAGLKAAGPVIVLRTVAAEPRPL